MEISSYQYDSLCDQIILRQYLEQAWEDYAELRQQMINKKSRKMVVVGSKKPNRVQDACGCYKKKETETSERHLNYDNGS